MKAMIMAAGVGKRLMPLTVGLPKPMVPVGNQPLMDRMISLLAEQGFHQLISNIHYHPQAIVDYFQEGRAWGVSLQYSYEEELLGTAGGVKKCAPFFDDTFAVISGDALTDVNLIKLWEAHKKEGALATIALKSLPEVEKYGVVLRDDKGQITAFQEKPKRSGALSHNANTGIYIFEPEIFNYIPENSFYDFGSQLFPELVRKGVPFIGVEIDAYWCDIGDIDVYKQAHRDMIAGGIALNSNFGKLVKHGEDGRIMMGEHVNTGLEVRWQGFAVIGSHCSIGAHSIIEDTIIWDHTVIGDGVHISDSIIGAGCRIEPAARVTGVVVASGTHIK